MIAVAAVFPAWWIARAAFGDLLVRHDPEAALQISPRDPRALVRAAEGDLSGNSPRFDAASRRLRSALLADPLNARIYTDLGLAAMARNDDPLVDRLFAISAARSRRLAAADLWLFDRAISAGDFAAACDALDVILRTQPPALFEIVAGKIADLSAEPGARAPLTRLLAGNPPWRSGLLEVMSASPASADAVEPILDRLAATSHPATEAEVNGVLEAAIVQGDFARAMSIWRRLSPSGRAAPPGLVNNGRFRSEAAQTPFAWTPAPDAGGAAILGGLSGGAGLRVILTDRSAQSPLISQLLVAPPGVYVLAGKVRAPERAIAGDIGLTWMLVCAGTRQLLTETPLLFGGDRWATFRTPSIVPGRQCPAQWLELHRRGSLTGLADGAAVWFDDLSLTPGTVASR